MWRVNIRVCCTFSNINTDFRQFISLGKLPDPNTIFTLRILSLAGLVGEHDVFHYTKVSSFCMYTIYELFLMAY